MFYHYVSGQADQIREAISSLGHKIDINLQTIEDCPDLEEQLNNIRKMATATRES